MKSPLINDLDFLTTLMVDLPNTRILFLTVTVDNFVNESNKLYNKWFCGLMLRNTEVDTQKL